MKTVIVVIFVFLFSNAAKAQNTFEKVVDTLGSGGANCIMQTFDGGYIYCGVCSLNGNDAIIVKLDSIGTIEWVKRYSGPGIESADYIEQLPDSGYIVNAIYDGGLYSKSWLLRLDVNGDSLWTKTFSAGTGATDPSVQNSMTSVNSAIYGLTGYYKPMPPTFISAFFIATAGNGFQLSNKIYSPSIYGTDSRSIEKTFDGGFVMAGVIGKPFSQSDIYVIRTNTYGDTLWTKAYDLSWHEAAFDIFQTNDSGFIITGIVQNLSTFQYNLSLIKTDSNGDTLWTKLYGGSLTCEGRSILQTKDGGYVVVGTINNPDPQVYILKANQNGDTIWTKEFGSIAGDHGYFVKQTKDGGYIISGDGFINGVGGAYIIKTDSLGNINSGTGVAEVNNPFKFNIYPNPSTGIFQVHVNGMATKTASLYIYNTTSQLVYAGNIINNKPKQINLSELASGIYSLRTIIGSHQYFSKKIVIQK